MAFKERRFVHDLSKYLSSCVHAYGCKLDQAYVVVIRVHEGWQGEGGIYVMEVV